MSVGTLRIVIEVPRTDVRFTKDAAPQLLPHELIEGDTYFAVVYSRDGQVIPARKTLRASEVGPYLSEFNRFSDRSGVVAWAVPMSSG